MQDVKVAVVGVGAMGTQHAEAYDRNPLCELVAVVDVREDVAHAVAERFGVKGYCDVAAMLAGCEVDAVSVCTSDESHAEPALACLAAEKHVLLEKPIATTTEDADAIIEGAERGGVSLLIGHIVRFDPRYALVKERVDAGELGELAAVFARRLNHVGSQDVLQGRVSVLSFLGVHDFDYILWISGSRPARVHTESVAKVHRAAGYGVEDHTFTLIRFADGLVACVEAGWILPNSHPRRADIKLEVIGTRGMAQVDLLAADTAICTPEGWSIPPLGHAIDAEVTHFLRCALGEAEPLATGEDGREALRLSLAAQESARTGETVAL